MLRIVFLIIITIKITSTLVYMILYYRLIRCRINMESSNTASDIKKLERGTTKLKFGIERLLAQDKKEDETMPSVSRMNNPITKPVPQIAVPCSDCVSSIFRCCR